MSVPSTASETAAAIRNKELKAVEAVEAALQRIERANPALNAFVHPAASVPAGISASGLPIGLQIVAPRHLDTLLLSVSAAYEQARPWGFVG